MFERFTEDARRVLFFGRYEASQLGDLEIKVEHLLLGLARTTAGVAARIFADRGISLDDIRRDIETRSAFREKVSTSIEIPFDSETKCALQFAAEEADRLRHQHIGTEHLLLGILRAEPSAAAAMLINRGLDLAKARDAVMQLDKARAVGMQFVGDAESRSASSHCTEASALIRSIDHLLGRLAAFASNSDEARSLIQEIRQRVRALERHYER